MKKFITIICSMAIFLCSLPIIQYAFAETTENAWIVVEDFDGDGDKTTAEYVTYGSSSDFYDNGEDGNAWQKNLTGTYSGPEFKLSNIQSYVPNVSWKNVWYKYDLIGPNVINPEISADGTFTVEFYFNDANYKFRMASVAEAESLGVTSGYYYYRTKGESEWTKSSETYAILHNNFNGEIMFPLSNFCINASNGALLTANMNISSGYFKEQFLYSSMASGESFAVDNISITGENMSPEVEEDKEDAQESVWAVAEDFDGDGDKAAKAYAVWGKDADTFYSNGKDGNAFTRILTDTYTTPGFWLPNIQQYVSDVSWKDVWYKFDLKGPAALNSSVSATDTFTVEFHFNDASKQFRMASESEGEVLGVTAGYYYYRIKGESEWTKAIGYYATLPNNFDGEIMLPLSNFCITSNALATADMNIASGYFSERFQYANMSVGESYAIDNISVTGENMSPEIEEDDDNSKEETKDDFYDGETILGSGVVADGDWMIVETFDGEVSDRDKSGNKTATDYFVYPDKSNMGFYSNGEESIAVRFIAKGSSIVPGVWLPNVIQYLPEAEWETSWYKFEMMGPAVIDSSVSADGAFQVSPRFNDTVRECRMADSSEFGDLAGCIFIREKGKTTWTKYTGKIFSIPNDFNGEIMFPLCTMCVNNSNGEYLSSAMCWDNSYFSDRTAFSGLSAGESIVIDNIAISGKDMTPKKYNEVDDNSVRTDGEWVIIEDFDSGSDNPDDYTVYSTDSAFINNGKEGYAFKFNLKSDWTSPGIWLHKAGEKLPKAVNETLWYKYDIKGPKALNSNADDGYFQVQLQFNDTVVQTRMGWSYEFTDMRMTGCAYYRQKGKKAWTRIVGANFILPNDFDGELMFDMSLLTVIDGNKYRYKSLLNTYDYYFSERILYSLLSEGESIAIDNICMTTTDMTPATYETRLQYFLQPVSSTVGTKTAEIVNLNDGSKGVKVTVAEGKNQICPGTKLGSTVDLDANFYEFYIEGPGGEGTFQLSTFIQGANGWVEMGSDTLRFFKESVAGAVYLKPEGSNKFYKYYTGQSFQLPRDFKGIVRYEVCRFTVKKTIGGKFTTDSTYFSFLNSGDSLVLGNFRALKCDMVYEKDWIYGPVEESATSSNTSKDKDTEDGSSDDTTDDDVDKIDMDAFFGDHLKDKTDDKNDSTSADKNPRKNDKLIVTITVAIVFVLMVVLVPIYWLYWRKRKKCN